MVAAATTVQRQTFYWVGSNTAMINAGFSQVPAGSTVGYGFSGPWGYQASFGTLFPTTATGDVYWGDKDNWMVQVRGATLTTTNNPTTSSTGGFSGGASAGVNLSSISSNNQKGYYWKPATRIPHRGDTVIFKYIPQDHVSGLTFTAPLSPCLFGGRGNSGGNMWIGDLSGGMTTGNANAVGPIRKVLVDRSYFEMGGTGGMLQGKVPYPGFFWGIPEYVGGATADGIHFGGLNVNAQFVDIFGPGVTSFGVDPARNFTDPHGIYINDVENCTDLHVRSMNFVTYGGTCNNMIFDSHISTGLTGFRSEGVERIELPFSGSSGANFGYIHTKNAILDTLNITPTLWNARTIIEDPGNQLQNIVYGPHTTRGQCPVTYYGISVNTIEMKPTARIGGLPSDLGDGSYQNADFEAGTVAQITSGPFFTYGFRKTCGLYVGGYTADPLGAFGSSDRIEIQTLKFSGENDSWGDAINANPSYSSNFYKSFNNCFFANSGMTIQNIELFDGSFAVSHAYDGGNTYDFDYENQAIGISAGFVGSGSHMDMRHPEDQEFSNVFLGDSSSSDPNRGLLFFGGNTPNYLISFAPTQYVKFGPPVTGQTGAASSTTERSRTIRRVLPNRD